MEYYFAPMEGITGYVFRNAHHRHFNGISRYYTPFIAPGQTRRLTGRELEDVRPENNKGVPVVPQILTNKAEDFLWAAGILKEMGYGEVNLNLGCPSGTVTAKHRGAGFLALPERLDEFLFQITGEMELMGLSLSVKTRIGVDTPEEFEELLRIYNQYPIKQLIVHPRLLKDYYKNTPNMEMFSRAAGESASPVCYNGDLFSEERIRLFEREFPQIRSAMLGRGLLSNPFLGEEGSGAIIREEDRRRRLKAFHEDVLEGYRRAIPGDRNVLFKMKELWSYLAFSFAQREKPLKKLKKARDMADYRAAAGWMLDELPLAKPPVFGGYS
ncbi:MAG: tRNA-dihydrouridine synthase family protein [Eubacteriales bacterium]|nr:tRNA-dihydrouridine synthase family protein [Eubacteriales bacterium]